MHGARLDLRRIVEGNRWFSLAPTLPYKFSEPWSEEARLGWLGLRQPEGKRKESNSPHAKKFQGGYIPMGLHKTEEKTSQTFSLKKSRTQREKIFYA